ncbi:hypothetical protein CEXT_469001 [Caerostris extrusa]|uniref:Uncharacterized protein n=1 Tax=Caerostris extrusa TaxID=172846 RepID=A0AAV4Q4X0_CAEEX|nr:hypothetical protein CEXT_469001 [Caerostris extrusa]
MTPEDFKTESTQSEQSEEFDTESRQNELSEDASESAKCEIVADSRKNNTIVLNSWSHWQAFDIVRIWLFVVPCLLLTSVILYFSIRALLGERPAAIAISFYIALFLLLMGMVSCIFYQYNRCIEKNSMEHMSIRNYFRNIRCSLPTPTPTPMSINSSQACPSPEALLQVLEQKEENIRCSLPTPSSINSSQTFPSSEALLQVPEQKEENIRCSLPTPSSINSSQTFPSEALLQVPEQKEENIRCSLPTPSSINSSQTFPSEALLQVPEQKEEIQCSLPTPRSINYSQTFITPEALLQVLKQKGLIVEEVTTKT